MPNPSSHHGHRSTHSQRPRSTQQQQSASRSSQPTSPGPSIASISDSRLGLAPEDVATLRRLQHAAHESVRSPAGSQASSQGRLLLDSSSLTLLGVHFERVMGAIGQRLDQLNHAMAMGTGAQHDRAASSIQAADQEIARFQALMGKITDLEMEMDKIRRLREIVGRFRARVEQMEARLD